MCCAELKKLRCLQLTDRISSLALHCWQVAQLDSLTCLHGLCTFVHGCTAFSTQKRLFHPCWQPGLCLVRIDSCVWLNQIILQTRAWLCYAVVETATVKVIWWFGCLYFSPSENFVGCHAGQRCTVLLAFSCCGRHCSSAYVILQSQRAHFRDWGSPLPFCAGRYCRLKKIKSAKQINVCRVQSVRCLVCPEMSY